MINMPEKPQIRINAKGTPYVRPRDIVNSHSGRRQIQAVAKIKVK